MKQLREALSDMVMKGALPISTKTIQVLSYYLIPLALGIYFLILYTTTNVATLRIFSANSGIAGYYLLIAIMMVSPLSKLFANTRLFARIVGLRRPLGVLVFYLLLIHMVGLAMFYNLFTLKNLIEMVKSGSFIIPGLIGFILMTLLAVTSNTLSAKVLKTSWKYVQMLAYPALLFAVIHVAVFRRTVVDYILLSTYLILKSVEYMKKN